MLTIAKLGKVYSAYARRKRHKVKFSSNFASQFFDHFQCRLAQFRAKLFTSDLCNVLKLSGLLMKPDSLPCKVNRIFLVKILNWNFSAKFQVEILAKIYAKILLSQNFSATKILWMSYQLLWRVSIVLLHVAARNSPYCQFWLKILAKFPCWKF